MSSVNFFCLASFSKWAADSTLVPITPSTFDLTWISGSELLMILRAQEMRAGACHTARGARVLGAVREAQCRLSQARFALWGDGQLVAPTLGTDGWGLALNKNATVWPIDHLSHNNDYVT